MEKQKEEKPVEKNGSTNERFTCDFGHIYSSPALINNNQNGHAAHNYVSASMAL